MRVKLIAGLAVALACVGLAGTAQAQSKRAAVAVMDFDYGTIDNWWGQYDIGKGMADQVIDALVNDGTFRVIERKKLDTVLGVSATTRLENVDLSNLSSSRTLPRSTGLSNVSPSSGRSSG